MERFFQQIVEWQLANGRKGLPWQETADPYRIWLSEIMLQQTQVSSVIAYYQKFLQTFPTVYALANASIDEVLAHWSGLGYYARARNLHKAAQMVVDTFDGKFPSDPNLLASLPGVGQSTANAIAAFSYGVTVPILDGNVKRLMIRYLGLQESVGGTAQEKKLWPIAINQVPADATHREMIAYTQGVMDMGNLVCKRTKPQCQVCPVAASCQAYHANQQDELPLPKPKKTVQTKRAYLCIYQNKDQIWLEKRPDSGIWGGLWSFPEEVDVIEASINLPVFTHVFTHFKLEISPLLITNMPPKNTENGNWFLLEDALTQGVPQPVRRIIETIAAMQQDYRLQSQN
ncbi:A/G-specific adenine glycosylase [Leeia sp. TBRC 13508]|uniref:Adenine DNA glycosylase n=1 Tax=Leeia speluncae TaxID=2884804 RepID=A0ABS8D5Z2_9NEIS|nr:A/G-specific adenine glycosylase [Leeia speluncae]MCB6183631.1 A/G-specific adenine glycosylase [Leeia speluncae]